MLLRTAAATLLIGSPALAQQAATPPSSPQVDWSGLSAGLSAGFIRSTGEAVREDFEGALLTLDVQNGLFPSSIEDADVSAIGGVMLGYDRQRGNIVGGLELDFSLTGSEAKAGFSRIDPNPDPIFNGVNTITGYRTELNGLATARLRVGYSFGETLLYGTGGLALGDVENRFTLALPELGYTSPDWSEDGIRVGYAIGAGLERKVTPRIAVRGELLHYNLEDTSVHASDPTNFPGQSITYEFENSGLIGRVGIRFTF